MGRGGGRGKRVREKEGKEEINERSWSRRRRRRKRWIKRKENKREIWKGGDKGEMVEEEEKEADE